MTRRRVIARIEDTYAPRAEARDEMDGAVVSPSGDWRFNLRAFHTEPLLRLNIEAHGNPIWCAEKLAARFARPDPRP